MLEVIRNPQQPRHKELLEWVGGNYDQPGTTWKKKASGPIFGLKNAPELWPPGASADAPDSATQACRKDTNFPKGLPRGWACDGRGCNAGINQTVPNQRSGLRWNRIGPSFRLSAEERSTVDGAPKK